MGCATSKKQNPQGNVLRTTNNLEKDIEKKLSPMLSLTNEHNVNKKYEYVMEVIPDKLIGSGIYQTNAYKSKIAQDQLEQKVEEFWESRNEGNPEVWVALRSSIDIKNEG